MFCPSAFQEEIEITDQFELNTRKLADDDTAVASVAPSADGQSQDDGGQAVDPMIGYLLDGRYELLEAIGSGGMSIVYKARLNNVNKLFAIKTLNIQVQAKDNVRERFHREIDLLLKLEHPHIVSVQDCLYGPNSQPYLVMDLLRGVSLEQELSKCGAIAADRVRKIMIQVCAALKYAHQHSVVHRDLKPGNIMLLENEADFVKVLDFGLALIGENTRKITQSGEFWGSPPYASPEQVKGNNTDSRSDIYSLGCVMYELLTGKDPFSGAGLYELLNKHVNETPAPLAVTKPDVQVPPEMERIVFKCMEKEPQDRFQTVGDLQSALEAIGSGVYATNTLTAQVSSFTVGKGGASRLRNESSLDVPPEAVSSGSRTTILIAAVLVVLVIAVIAMMSIPNGSKTHTSSGSQIRAQEDAGSLARSGTDNENERTLMRTNEPPPSRTAASTAKRSQQKNTSRSRRTDSPARSQPATRNKQAITPAAAMRESKQTAPAKGRPKGDPFANLREHLSTGAKSE